MRDLSEIDLATEFVTALLRNGIEFDRSTGGWRYERGPSFCEYDVVLQDCRRFVSAAADSYGLTGKERERLKSLSMMKRIIRLALLDERWPQ